MPTAFEINERNEFWDPTLQRWYAQSGPGSENIDFAKQRAANLAEGRSAVWTRDGGWENPAPIPQDWSQPAQPVQQAPQQPVQQAPQQQFQPFQPRGMFGNMGMNPFGGMFGGGYSPFGMGGYGSPYQFRSPMGMFGGQSRPGMFGMNPFFSSYWGR